MFNQLTRKGFLMKTKLPSALLPTTTLRLDKAGKQIRYSQLGNPENPPLLLLHGVPENLQAWYAVAPQLAEKF